MNRISSNSSLNSSPLQHSSVAKATTNAFDKRIKDLMEQTTKLNEQIEKVNQNKNLDEKIRMERTTAIRDQIQQIEAQISQIRAEQLSKQQKDSDKADKNNDAKDDTKMDIAIKIGVAFDTVKTMNKTKGQMERESQNLKNDVRKDRFFLENKVVDSPDDIRSLSMMKENLESTTVKSKLHASNEIDAKITMLDKNISKAYDKIKDTMGQTVRNEKQENEIGTIPEEQPIEDNTTKQDSKSEGSKKIEHKQIDIRI
ncbi:hypothetical protein Back11_48130 [Paenibacillus baekrokdamisoli]|uniref:Uncharacterized protein n=1 Tax=Paenibacillus baekrokdamisoli TaxID=1712516 RepID=A0A3G9JHE8_9BACL|nr:FlxA-like family protein [Paenibacillus baekrokdamisoli]MBB3068635.1 putative lipase [Paenibacillus baekrokdamisoli]BBH23468.1 hypothetical protein Back11_48130 [Paenibacillus baekrokdamisoli]